MGLVVIHATYYSSVSLGWVWWGNVRASDDRPLLAAVFVQNRIKRNSTKKTPFELWYGYKPDVSNLRVFGALAYMYVPMKMNEPASGHRNTKRQKLDYKSVREIFLGYAETQKNWKVLDCVSGAIMTLCHVTFNKTFSAAAEELRRQKFRQLSTRVAMDFNYYSRTATSEVDLLFYSGKPQVEKPTSREVLLLKDFVDNFDMKEVNLATALPALDEYAPRARAYVVRISPQALTMEKND